MDGQFRPGRVSISSVINRDEVPTWNGNMETILLWLDEVDGLARLSPTVETLLGWVVPLRL